MPISFSRVAARESVRFATFAHAIMRTNATAPSKISSRVRTSATMPFCNGTALTSAFQAEGIGHGNSSRT